MNACSCSPLEDAPSIVAESKTAKIMSVDEFFYYDCQSITKEKKADSIPESTISAVGTVGTVGTTNACKIRRIGHSDRFECEDCGLKDDIHFMKIHLCKDSKLAYLHQAGPETNN